MTLAMSLPSLGLPFSLLCPLRVVEQEREVALKTHFFKKCPRRGSHFLSFILLLSFSLYNTEKHQPVCSELAQECATLLF